VFFEGFDNDHWRTAGLADVSTGRWLIVNPVCCRVGIVAEELTQPLHVFDPGMVGKQAVVADAMEA
jgi:hypothetical protein